MAKHRANRKPLDLWEKLKGLICELYATNTLQFVMEVLRDEHDFGVTKRQLVYRLEKWGCKKYNTGDPEPEGQTLNKDATEERVISGTPYGGFARQNQVPWVFQGADALFAVCDTGGAWKAYSKIDADGLPNIAALARSAETPHECESTLELLEKRISSLTDFTERSRICLLRPLICNAQNYQLKKMQPQLNTSVSYLLDNPDCLRPNGSVDMLVYILLDNINENHQDLVPSEVWRLKLLLDKFDTWVLSAKPDHQTGQSPVHVLRQCAEWCDDKLSRASYTAARPNLDILTGQYQVLWRDHIEVFGALWRAVIEQCIFSGEWPEWAKETVEAMNLSHAEVLSCICWVIVWPPHIIRDSEHHAAEHGGDLFTRAKRNANDVLQSSSAALWEAFRDAFVRINKPTAADTDENRDFHAYAMQQFRSFVKDTLGEFGGPGLCEDDTAPASMTSLLSGGELMVMPYCDWRQCL
ncbi:uncharacterized protein CTRU02_202317 [Colletotrichum truncatum]|uniref:Uncharacterized protein n=1 Tax=Colletotrichum truncatum TaxID=5467 RepID=A0ACC3ZK43_COLTU|nr:uncharacterized protein CTRU02_01477 [Colletotrichum truncatum]KAF6799798.1 hypothetical protein CTRU02_01477 [Colletotrichum truncatum]